MVLQMHKENGNQMRPLPGEQGERRLFCHNEEIGFWKVVKKEVGITRRPRYRLKVIQDVDKDTFMRAFLKPFEVWKV